jgi:hypothetical protein
MGMAFRDIGAAHSRMVQRAGQSAKRFGRSDKSYSGFAATAVTCGTTGSAEIRLRTAHQTFDYGIHQNNKFELFRTIGQLDRARGYCCLRLPLLQQN